MTIEVGGRPTKKGLNPKSVMSGGNLMLNRTKIKNPKKIFDFFHFWRFARQKTKIGHFWSKFGFKTTILNRKRYNLTSRAPRDKSEPILES